MPEKQGLAGPEVLEKKPLFHGPQFEPLFAFQAAESRGAEAESAPHWHNYLEMAHLTEGALTVTLDGKARRIERPSLIVIRPGVIHSFSACSRDAALRIFMSGFELYGENENDIRERVRRDSACAEQIFGEDFPGFRSTVSLLDEIFAEYSEKRTGWQLMVRAKLLEVEVNYFRFISPDGEANGGKNKPRQNERFERALAVIHSRFSDAEFSIGEAACAAGLSESRFTRFFRQHSGVHFHEYLVNLRLAFAKEQLCGTEKKVTVIAGDCGFNSLATFNRLFKKKTGLSPQLFRSSL
jgi:AraC-like DNA-binding protein